MSKHGRVMDASERSVCHYLQNLNLGEVAYEPDGNVPPDFLVGNRIAVESRRLNQHVDSDGSFQSLEIAAAPLLLAVNKILAESGPPLRGKSWFVLYTIWRPLPPWRTVEALLRAAVRQFQESIDDPLKEIRLHRSLRLRFFAASQPHEQLLVLGGSTDHDSGGFVVAEVIRNLKFCLSDKARKIKPVRHKYEEWWLALEDRIAYGQLDASDIETIRAELGSLEGFARVLLINPVAPQASVELYPS